MVDKDKGDVMKRLIDGIKFFILGIPFIVFELYYFEHVRGTFFVIIGLSFLKRIFPEIYKQYDYLMFFPFRYLKGLFKKEKNN